MPGARLTRLRRGVAPPRPPLPRRCPHVASQSARASTRASTMPAPVERPGVVRLYHDAPRRGAARGRTTTWKASKRSRRRTCSSSTCASTAAGGGLAALSLRGSRRRDRGLPHVDPRLRLRPRRRARGLQPLRKGGPAVCISHYGHDSSTAEHARERPDREILRGSTRPSPPPWTYHVRPDHPPEEVPSSAHRWSRGAGTRRARRRSTRSPGRASTPAADACS